MILSIDEDVTFEAFAHMQQGQVIDLDSAIAIGAVSYGIEFNLPFADSIIYATARKCDATIWTQDAGLKGLKGVKFFPKSRSKS
ncbi:MAG: putative nucleic acid-binding protein [Pseudohongiellaceae bacterium]